LLDEVRRLALFTSGIAELTRNRAEKIVKNWTGGDVPNARASTMVKQLVETSKQNRTELLSLIRSEIKNQARTVGLADGREVERLERRVERLEEQLKNERAKSGTAKTTARKSSSKKSTRKSPKKTTAGRKKTAAGRKKTSARRGSSGSSSERTPAPGSPGRPLGRS
jgi:polyhydroxyalkanoate synthesis regulator phasin